LKFVLFHPHLDVKGGSERLTKILYEGLKELGHEALLVSFRADPDWFEDVIEIGDPEDLRPLVAKEAPDYVFLGISETHYAALLKGMAKIAMYVHFPLEEEVEEENLGDYERRGRFLFTSLDELALVDRLFVNSRRTAMAVKLVWGRDAVVAHPPLEPWFLGDGVKVEEPPPPHIICTGRFTPLKRQDFLIFIMEFLRKEVPEARLTLAGFPDPRHRAYLEEIKGLAKRVGGVEIVESPSDQELFDLYGTARVYAHPRIGEHFGISPCEAMARGIPVVMRGPTGLSDVTERFIAKSDWEFVEQVGRLLTMSDGDWLALSEEFHRKVQVLTPRNFAFAIVGGLK